MKPDDYARQRLREQLRAALGTCERIESLADEAKDYALSKDAKRASVSFLEGLARLIGAEPQTTAPRKRAKK